MDHAARQALRPGGFEPVEIGTGTGREAGRHRIGLGLRLREERTPSRYREVVLPGHREVAARLVKAGQRRAERPAMLRVRTAEGDAFQEGHDRRRPAAEAPERRAGAVAHRLRAGEPGAGQMPHQVDEERQVRLAHPLLVEGEDEVAGTRVQEEVRVLDPLRDALAGEQLAEFVLAEEGAQRLVGNVGVDRHGCCCRFAQRKGAPRAPLMVVRPGSDRRMTPRYSAASLRSSRGSGNDMSSIVTET